MGRKCVVGRNWKMNGNKPQIAEAVVGVPAVYMNFEKRNAPHVDVAAQNCYKDEKVAFTG